MAVSPAHPPTQTRDWPSWQICLTYAAPLLVLAWAPFVGVDTIVIALAGIAAGLTHWFWAPLTVTCLCLGTGQMIALANAEKLRDTGDAILWQDLVYTMPNLLGNLGTVWQYIGFPGVLTGTLAVLALYLTRMAEKRHIRRSLPFGIGFSAALMLVYLPTFVDYSVDIASDLKQYRKSAKSFAGRPHALSLARFLHSTTLPPAGFQGASAGPKHFRELSAKLAGKTGQGGTNAPPDIFVILNESQLNPSQLAACADRADCRMALYEKAPFGVLRGPLKVHTHGWGTWNAEFTLMTGVPYFWFGESGFYSAYTTAPRLQMALARHLASLGYRTIGIYPTQKGMLNAAQAYRHYGIQEFYGAESLDLPLDWCKIPDRLMYETMLAKYRAARKQDTRPIFMMMLTIFNHGPHGEGCMDSQLKQSLGRSATPQNVKLDDYLHRSNDADRASTAFRNALLALPQRVLLLFAGDHQPSFEGFARRYPRQMHRQMSDDDALLFTNFQYFANYESAATAGTGERYRELDISFLASTLLELAMLPLGPLFQPNLQLRELCRGRLDSCSPAIIDSYKAHLMQVGFYQ